MNETAEIARLRAHLDHACRDIEDCRREVRVLQDRVGYRRLDDMARLTNWALIGSAVAVGGVLLALVVASAPMSGSRSAEIAKKNEWLGKLTVIEAGVREIIAQCPAYMPKPGTEGRQ